MEGPAWGVRLAELAGAVSLACDVGHGASLEHGLRSAVLSVRLAELAGADEQDACSAFYLALVRWAGCTATSPVLASGFGDDIAAHERALRFEGPIDPLLEILRHAGAGSSLLARARTLLGALSGGPAAVFGPACEAGQELALRLGCSQEVGAGIGVAFERWDGRGWPGRAKGEAIPLAVRIVQIAEEAEHLGGEGTEAAAALVARRAGRQYDPTLAGVFSRHVENLFADLHRSDGWELALASEPGAPRVVPTTDLEGALLVFADFADLKSPWWTGHSRGVAALAGTAAGRLGLPGQDATAVKYAGLLHDLGRVAVPNTVWEHPGALDSETWEQVRLHAYQTERFLARAGPLAPLGRLAARHHERLDGSGYHAGLTASELDPLAKVLAAADAFQAMTEPRAHRPALALEQAATEVRAEITAGRLDRDAGEAVLEAAGQMTGHRRRGRPADLTPREIEVLQLLARGLSNRQIAGRLVVSNRTVGHHVAHIYAKAGVATRAGATLFALRHGLLEYGGER